MDESRCKFNSESGFSLIETMVATLLLAVSLTSLAQLFGLATRANFTARTTTTATVMAQQKMEQLRGLAWGFDRNNLPVSDFETDITTDSPTATGGAGLSASPGNALASNTPGYVDYLDANGHSLGGGATAPDSTVWVRRWSVQPLPANPNNTLILQVFVFKHGGRGEDLPDTEPVARFPEEARLVTVKTRKASS